MKTSPGFTASFINKPSFLTDISVFDVYTGENVSEDEKSIAYSLTFNDPSRTLTEEEVMAVFNKIITDVEKTGKGKLRD